VSEQHDIPRVVPLATKPLKKANFALDVRRRAQKRHL